MRENQSVHRAHHISRLKGHEKARTIMKRTVIPGGRYLAEWGGAGPGRGAGRHAWSNEDRCWGWHLAPGAAGC